MLSDGGASRVIARAASAAAAPPHTTDKPPFGLTGGGKDTNFRLLAQVGVSLIVLSNAGALCRAVRFTGGTLSERLV